MAALVFAIARARWVTAASLSGAWAVFALAYVGAVVFVAAGLREPVGSVLLVLAAGAQLSAYVGATIGKIGFLRASRSTALANWPGWRITPVRSLPTPMSRSHPG